MKHRVAIHSPGRLTVLAALIGGLSAGLGAPAFADPTVPVVISQVYGGGGNSGAQYKNDFIELHNRGTTAIDLSTWSVQYASSAGTSWQLTKLSGILQPGHYYLVQEAAGSGGTAALPQPDASGSLALSGTSGKVALVNNASALSGANPTSASLVDLVGFGSAATGYEGSGPTATLSNTTAAIRANGGCTDTDDNAADFATGAPIPRNSASAAKSCGTTTTDAAIVTNCPASVSGTQGSAIMGLLQASDADSIVSSASIVSGARAGIALGPFTPAAGKGGTASVQLQVDGSLAAGSYPVGITFTNDTSQSASCTVTVQIAGSVTIPQIQGSGPTSPYANTVQSTRGVLTAKVGSGFFIQDPKGDGDPTTSDGIFVFGASTDAQPGEMVEVTGTVTEYTPTGAARSYTELGNVTKVTRLGGSYTIAPTNIELPYPDLGRVEGMLVHITTPLTVSGNGYLGDRGELVLSNGRLEQPSNRYAPSSPEAKALSAANASNMIVLDDGIFTTPNPIPYIGQDGTVRSGDTVTDLTGVVDFGAAGGLNPSFKLQPTQAPSFSRTNPRPPAVQGTPGNLRVVSANIENFFTTFTDGTNYLGQTGQGCSLGSSVSKSNCRGADNLKEFQRQSTKLVADLKGLDADVAALMEVQNNGDITLSYIVDQLNTAYGSKVYNYVANVPVTGTDAIRVAMIYKPAMVTPVGAPITDGDSVNNRPPLAQTFKLNSNGAKFTLVANHLKSKGSCGSAGAGNSDSGDGQGCWTGTRVLQAQRLLNYLVPQIKQASGDDRILLVGDMNAYGHEDPIATLTSNGFVNEVERFKRPEGTPYSYVFAGLSGYLDHALASTALDGQVAGILEWHINADEPDALGYDLNTGLSQDLYQANQFRESDHDPLVIGLNLAPAFVDVTGGVKIAQTAPVPNRITGKYSATVTFTNTSGAALSGPLQFRLDGLTAGVTLDNASGSQNGAPYITLPSGSLAVGASATVTTTFSNPAKTAITYKPALIQGAF
ncbi:ExeM/NucH family extracellular endonuclease [Massilia sp. 9096]|uniref:ExeM/NucH family extracellular endonuclease n=1 Tax=Massilia sp. 9096 TaxID=1500894 RepID=UPI00055E56DA|nr:ExeM/NucH family extracellular endonuclease [Massilia sp. 9096]